MPKAPEKTRKPRTTVRAVSTAKAAPDLTSKTVEVSADSKTAAKRPRTFEEMLGEQSGSVREIARQLRQLIFDLLPGVTETPFGGNKVQLVLYSLGGPTKTICGIQPSSDACLLYLHHVSTEDSQTLLIEGQGKHSHHVRVDAMTNLAVRDIKRLLALAKRRAKVREVCSS
jgi:hypothetical protein